MAITDELRGDFIARGTNRSVWEYKPNREWVIKYEHSQIRANRDEAHTRRILALFGVDWFLAPCRYLPKHQAILMLKGTVPKPGWWDIPIMIPWQNPDNFRLIDSRLVLIDYDWRLVKQNSDLFWFMPEWDWQSISDCEPYLGTARPADFEEFALPGERYLPPRDQQHTESQFVRVKLNRDSVRACFEKTRTVWLDTEPD